MIRLVKIAVAYVVGYGVGFVGLLALLAVVGILTACTLIQRGTTMYVLRMLNSNKEWELCVRLFDTEQAALAYYKKHFSMFEDYDITQMEHS